MRFRSGSARARGALLAALVALAAGCPGSGPASPPASPGARAAVPVAVEPVERRIVQREVTVYGTLYGDEEATISNKVPGRIRRIAADVGDVVSAGAVLCELEVEDFELAANVARRQLEAVLARLGVDRIPDASFEPDKVATVERARAHLENAKGKLARLDALEKKGQGFVAEQTLKDAETEVTMATASLDAERLSVRAHVAEAHQRQAELALAERRQQDATIRAPGGERQWAIAERLVSRSEYLREGTNVFKVVASDPLKLRTAVPERFVRELSVGLEAQVKVEAYADRTFAGRVSRLNPSIDIASRTFGLEILIANEAGLLKPHMSARGAVLTRKDEALLVPIEAVVSFAGVTKVFALEGGKARERIVKVGPRFGGKLEVTGVEAEARVLIRGQTVVADGTAVVVSGSSQTSGSEAR